jgi:ribosome-associated protein
MTEELNAKVETIVSFLDDQRCKDVTVIDVQGRCSWTDSMVVATVNSVGHLRGVAHELWSVLKDLGLTVNDRHKTPNSDGWTLIDCDEVVIHLMSEEMRDFYNIEKLWKLPEPVETVEPATASAEATEN